MELSMDKKIRQHIEQGHVELYGEKRQPSDSTDSSGSSNQLDRINTALNRPGISESAKEMLRKKQQSLANGTTSKSVIVGISSEDTQALLLQLQRFQGTIGNDWKSLISQWQNLQNCWQDYQYERFEPFFEQLSNTYGQCKQQCEEYNQFLEERIHASEDATAMLNV
jgi:hypothetical protein